MGGTFTHFDSLAVDGRRVLFWGLRGVEGALVFEEAGQIDYFRLGDGSTLDSGTFFPQIGGNIRGIAEWHAMREGAANSTRTVKSAFTNACLAGSWRPM